MLEALEKMSILKRDAGHLVRVIITLVDILQRDNYSYRRNKK